MAVAAMRWSLLVGVVVAGHRWAERVPSRPARRRGIAVITAAEAQQVCTRDNRTGSTYTLANGSLPVR
jgi:hypothetical protein